MQRVQPVFFLYNEIPQINAGVENTDSKHQRRFVCKRSGFFPLLTGLRVQVVHQKNNFSLSHPHVRLVPDGAIRETSRSSIYRLIPAMYGRSDLSRHYTTQPTPPTPERAKLLLDEALEKLRLLTEMVRPHALHLTAYHLRQCEWALAAYATGARICVIIFTSFFFGKSLWSYLSDEKQSRRDSC